ncbi:MAG: hypothetical protein ACKOXN_12365, partial [Limnohabitans sp.]
AKPCSVALFFSAFAKNLKILKKFSKLLQFVARGLFRFAAELLKATLYSEALQSNTVFVVG